MTTGPAAGVLHPLPVVVLRLLGTGFVSRTAPATRALVFGAQDHIRAVTRLEFKQGGRAFEAKAGKRQDSASCSSRAPPGWRTPQNGR